MCYDMLFIMSAAVFIISGVNCMPCDVQHTIKCHAGFVDQHKAT